MKFLPPIIAALFLAGYALAENVNTTPSGGGGLTSVTCPTAINGQLLYDSSGTCAGTDLTYVTSAGYETLQVNNASNSMAFNVPTGQGYQFSINGANVFDQGVTTANVWTFHQAIAATLSNVATTSAVCFNTSTKLFTYDGTIGTCNTSTVRVKHDLRPMSEYQPNPLEAVLRMQPKTFYYNDEHLAVGEQLGLVAEDLAAIDRHLVSYDDSGQPNAIRFLGPMFSYMIGAIKELKFDNDNLRAEIEALKNNANAQKP